MSIQYALDISLPIAYAPEQFICSDSNSLAYSWIMRWPDWPDNSLYLQGESGGGKTHLAHIWQLRTNGNFLAFDNISDNISDNILDNSSENSSDNSSDNIHDNDDSKYVASFSSAKPCIIDDIEKWRDEKLLFHIYNHCKANNIPLLITSACKPSELNFTLPDLLSRLKSMSFVAIDAPDDILVAGLLCKHLADRQIKIAPDVMNYLLPRVPRSFSAIAELVEKLDKGALAVGRSLTVPFVRDFL